MLEMESAADRAAFFFDSSDLALFAKVEKALDDEGAASVIVERNVRCLFDRAFRQVGNSEGYHPIALCMDEDVVYIEQFHRIMLKGQVWHVDGRQPDGTGFTQLILKKVGRYRYEENDPNVLLGFPYTFPATISDVKSHDGPLHVSGFPYTFPATIEGAPERPLDNPLQDPKNPRLAYPYTVKTYIDWQPGEYIL